MKYLSIDYGEKRIGLSISDDLGVIAKPLPPLKVRSLSDGISKIHTIVKKHNIAICVIGLPLGPKREETKQSIQIRYFADALKSTNGAEVEFWNESFSTQEAVKNTRKGTKRKKKSIDSEAARIILQEYLDNRKAPKTTNHIFPNYESLLK